MTNFSQHSDFQLARSRNINEDGWGGDGGREGGEEGEKCVKRGFGNGTRGTQRERIESTHLQKVKTTD